MDFFTDRLHRMRITRNGNIGIGLDNPSARLEINSGVLGSSGLKFSLLNSLSNTPITNNTAFLGIDLDGNVIKIQSPSPQSVCYLSSFLNIEIAIDFLNSSNTINTLIIDKSTSMINSKIINSNKTVKFVNGNIINMPSVTLTVNGTIESGINQIFNCSNGGVVNGMPKISQSYPQWWQDSTNNLDWTLSIQNAVDFYPKVYFMKGFYTISNSIELSANLSHHLYGESVDSEIINQSSGFTFKLHPQSEYNKGCIIEKLKFTCAKGIQFNNTDVAFVDGPQAKYILNTKINNCYFKKRVESDDDSIAIQFNLVFDSEISNNQIYGFGIGVNLRGSDINTISKNRIMNFYKFGILDEGYNTFGSQNGIYNNDILSFKGLTGTGAMIKSSSRIIIIKDNYLENNPTNKINAFIDCSNFGLLNSGSYVKAKPLHIDIRGNRLDIGYEANHYFIIQDDFASLIIDSNRNSYHYTPPSKFIDSDGNYYTNYLKSKMNNAGIVEKEIHISSCTSFGEWNNFHSTAKFDKTTNGGFIIDSRNISSTVTVENHSNGHVLFNPFRFKIQNDNRNNLIKLNQGISDGEKELFKRIKIRVKLRGVQSSQDAQIYMRALNSSNQNMDNIYNDSPALTDDYQFIDYLPNIDYPDKMYIVVGSDVLIQSIEIIPITTNKNLRTNEINEDKINQILEQLNKLENDLKVLNSELKIIKDSKINQSSSEIILYPNPVNNSLNISFKNSNSTLFNFDLFDISGKLILSSKFSNTSLNYKIDLSHLLKNTYIYKIESESFFKTGVIMKN